MKEEFYKTSEVTGITYDVFKSVKILNVQQAIFYMEREVRLLDLQTSRDRVTERPVFVFVFDKGETREAYDAWCAQKGAAE